MASLFYYITAVLGVNLLVGRFMGCYSDGNLLDPYYYFATSDTTLTRAWWVVAGNESGCAALLLVVPHSSTAHLTTNLVLLHPNQSSLSSHVTCRCEDSDGQHTVNTSIYHAALNVTVPEWQVNTTWGANGVLTRFDNVLMALWVLLQVSLRA